MRSCLVATTVGPAQPPDKGLAILRGFIYDSTTPLLFVQDAYFLCKWHFLCKAASAYVGGGVGWHLIALCSPAYPGIGQLLLPCSWNSTKNSILLWMPVQLQ